MLFKNCAYLANRERRGINYEFKDMKQYGCLTLPVLSIVQSIGTESLETKINVYEQQLKRIAGKLFGYLYQDTREKHNPHHALQLLSVNQIIS
jgi:hypothetical protein